MDIYNYTCIYSDYTYNYTSMNNGIVTHIRVDYIFKSFKCYIQKKIEKIWKTKKSWFHYKIK